jgi:hypothetical protein
MSCYRFDCNGTGKRVLLEALELQVRTLEAEREALQQQLSEKSALLEVTREMRERVQRTTADD